MRQEVQPVGGRACWRGPDIDWRKEGLFVLKPSHVSEIDRALAHLKALGRLDLVEVDREAFPLEDVAGLCEAMGRNLHSGQGFAMLRGLPRERFTPDDMARIFIGIGAWFGTPLVQSHQGEVLVHLMDLSDLEDNPRVYHSGGRIGMHTDSCDVVGLMCLRTARQGGDSRIASAVAVHDELVRTRPDLAEALYRGFTLRRMELDARFGSGSVQSSGPVPAFTQSRAGFSCYFLGGYIRMASTMGGPALTAIELEAIEAVDRLASSPAFYLDLQFSDGDIQFINNRKLLHGRTEYVDSFEVTLRRHLLRLWLAVPAWPPLPEEQTFHKEEDRRLWRLRRAPNMELPSRYLDASSRHDARAAESDLG